MNNNYNLLCIDEYKRLCQPLSSNSYFALEKELLSTKKCICIRVWRKAILCDFERYDICRKHNLSYRMIQIKQQSNYEALFWICQNQLSRSDLTDEMRRYLIGKMSVLERVLGMHDNAVVKTKHSVSKVDDNEPKYCCSPEKIRLRLGKIYGLHSRTIVFYEKFSVGIDRLYDISSDFADGIIKGNIKVSQRNIIEIGKMNDYEIKQALIGFENKSINKNCNLAREETKNNLLSSVGLIKNTPEVDPDAEITSLVLTIPWWISSMDRVREAVDLDKVSPDARSKVCKSLEQLCDISFELFHYFEEDK